MVITMSYVSVPTETPTILKLVLNVGYVRVRNLRARGNTIMMRNFHGEADHMTSHGAVRSVAQVVWINIECDRSNEGYKTVFLGPLKSALGP